MSESDLNPQPLPPEQPIQPTPPAARADNATRRGTVRSIHYTLSYLAQNPERGPQGAIVLLHDLPGGAFIWEDALPGLASTGRAVYAFDMLGYGHSEHPWPSDTSNWGQADCLQYAFEALKLTDITLVGIGVGGAVAQALATRLYRDKVARLVLINSYMYSVAFAPDWPLPEMAKRQDPEAPRHTKLEDLLSDLRAALPRGAAISLPDARVAAYTNEWNSHTGMEMLFQHIRLMRPDYVNSVSTDLELWPKPILLLWGDQDAVTPLSLGQRLAAANPHVRLEVLRGAGHLALDDAPGAVAQLLSDFVAQA
jgi:pimeloyl-ACP methyl ester carboxylesterase